MGMLESWRDGGTYSHAHLGQLQFHLGLEPGLGSFVALVPES